MYITEFIEKYYPITDKVSARISNPYKRVEEADDLPFDRIGPDETGAITKLVDIDNDRSISVMDLISYTKEDIDKMNDEPLKNCWEAYMEQVDIEDLNLIDIMESVRMYNKIKSDRKAQLDVLSVQKG